MSKIEIVPLTLEAIKAYKKNNPSKFAHKFGDLDLENLPENFDMAKHRRKIRRALPKTPLLDEEFADEEDEDEVVVAKVETVTPPRDDPDGNDNGGEALATNQTQ